jgi:hypothetical protein
MSPSAALTAEADRARADIAAQRLLSGSAP